MFANARILVLHIVVRILEGILHCNTLQMVLGIRRRHRLVDQLQVIEFVVGERERRLGYGGH